MTISRTSKSGSLAHITLAVSLLGVFATACSSKPATTNPATTTPPSASTIGSESAAITRQPVTAGVRINSTTPIAISSLAEFGENAYDAATASSWAKAGAIADSLTAGEPGLPTPSAEMNNTIQSLKSAIASKDRPAARHYANAVTRIATQMSAHYTDPAPSDVAMLDFYGREIELGVAAKDLAALKQTASKIDTIWARVRPLVESHGGGAVAMTFGDIVTKLNAASTPPEYGRLATPILDQVDNLEKVFTK
jgi:hypothetical protein